uniref:Uncharacterized protein n=1 Tax=Arion vulgaris TaxID=1028688 RepID=A0A0B6Y0G8_9EUPU
MTKIDRRTDLRDRSISLEKLWRETNKVHLSWEEAVKIGLQSQAEQGLIMSDHLQHIVVNHSDGLKSATC